MEKINYELVEKLSSDVEILKQIIKTSSAIATFNGLAKIIPNKNILINTLGIQESRSSNAIENIYTTNSEIFQSLALEEEVGNSKEIINYSKAVIEASKYIKSRPITRNLMEEIQGIVEPKKKGIRKIQVHINNFQTGEIVYTPPEAHEIENLLDDLIKFINIDFNNNEKINPLVNIIVAHYQFEKIHPFLDGNGRTGRILIVTQLLSCGFLDEPILYLSRYINETKDEYYKYLRNIGYLQEYNEWKNFMLYYLKAMENIAERSTDLVKHIENLITETKEDLLQIKFKRNTDNRLIDLLFEHPYFTRIKYEEWLNVKRTSATQDLKKLCDSGILKIVKEARYTYYVNVKLYDLLEKKE